MAKSILIAIGAGLVSATMYVSASTGSGLAALLSLVVPLPNFIAGLGWGARSALIAGLSGGVISAAILAPRVGLNYLLVMGIPVFVLAYLALLARPASGPGSPSGSGPEGGESAPTSKTGVDTAPPSTIEWYPLGRLIAWMAIIAGLIGALSVITIGTDLKAYTGQLQTFLDQAILPQVEKLARKSLSAEQRAQVVKIVVAALPVLAASGWFLMMALCMWLGGRIARASKLLVRPWPDFAAIAFPWWFPIGFAGAITITFTQGYLALLASAFAGAFVVAYLFMGLAVIHFVTRGQSWRMAALIVTYASLIVFGLTAVVAITIFGLAEAIFKLRARRARSGGRAPPPS